MGWVRCGLVVAVLCVGGLWVTSPAKAEDTLDFFHPSLLRRPIMERTLGIETVNQNGPQGRDGNVRATLDYWFLSSWQLELSVPVGYVSPPGHSTNGGIEDISVENKFLIFKSPRQRTILATGVNVTMPTGSAARGLGGETLITPFLTGGSKLGAVDLIGEINYRWIFPDDHGRHHAQDLTLGVAAGKSIARWLTGFIEVISTDRLVGVRHEPTGPALRNRLQLYLLPGVNIELAPGRMLVIGVEVPVTRARQFDYSVRAGFIWDF